MLYYRHIICLTEQINTNSIIELHPQISRAQDNIYFLTCQYIYQIKNDYCDLFFTIILTEVKDLDANFIRERITQLRLKKGISEYQMSYDLGHSRGYIYNISSGKALPPMKEFLAICDYFNISPQQFFDESTESPQLIQRAITGMQQLNEKDLIMLIGFIERLLHNEE